MVTNFDFLKKVDVNSYDIISDAEKLYRDEYFEQCITQTRRFAENICKNVLGKKRTSEETFDQMLATLKDNQKGSEQEKEFIEDLYFIKKCGNEAVHSSKVNKSGINALECLQRAFEIAINYTVYTKNGDKSNLNRHYDVTLLATGKKTKNLEKRYQKALDKESRKNKPKAKPKTKQQTSMKSCKKKEGIPVFWIVVAICSVVSFILSIYLLILK